MSETLYFTPSEVVLLNGESFVSGAGFLNKYVVLPSEQGVDSHKLAVAACSAAVLANEQFGLLRLTPSVNSTLFGLVKTPTLLLEPTGAQPGWPAGTLEADLFEVARRQQVVKRNNLYNVIYQWLGQDVGAPFYTVLQMVEQGLAQRGLLQQVEAKTLGIFKYKKLALPDSTRPLIAGQSIAPVQQLLQQCEQFRPDIWQRMQKNIQKAINARTEHTDTDD